MTARLAAALDTLRDRLEGLPPDRQDAAAEELLRDARLGGNDAAGGSAFGGPWPKPTPPDAADDSLAWAEYDDELRVWNQYHGYPDQHGIGETGVGG